MYVVHYTGALRLACANGHLGVARWLVERFELTLADVRAKKDYGLSWAVIQAHAPVVDWIGAEFGIRIEDVLAEEA